MPSNGMLVKARAHVAPDGDDSSGAVGASNTFRSDRPGVCAIENVGIAIIERDCEDFNHDISVIA